MKKKSILLMMVMLTLLTIQVFAVDYPKPAAWVNDYAGVLKAQQKQDLDTLLADFETTTTNQIFVCILQNLPADVSLEEYVNELFLRWKPGQEGKDNGVLLAIFLDDRALRIEAGYELEGKLTDAQSKLIIENSIAPSFKQGDYYAGIQKGIHAIIQKVAPEYTFQPKPVSPPPPRTRQPSRQPNLLETLAWQEYGLIALFVGLMGGVVIFMARLLIAPNSTSGWSGSRKGWQKKTTHSRTPRRNSFLERTKGIRLDVEGLNKADKSPPKISSSSQGGSGNFFDTTGTIRDRSDSSTTFHDHATSHHSSFGDSRDDNDKKSTSSSWSFSFSSSHSSGRSRRSHSSGSSHSTRSFSGGGGRSGGGGASGSW